MRKRQSSQIVRTAACLAFCLGLAACTVSVGATTSGPGSGGSTGSTGSSSGGGSLLPAGSGAGLAKGVRLADDVVVVQADAGRNVASVGKDGASLVLRAGTPGLDQLAVDKVMLLTGIGAARVTSLDPQGKDTAVSFKPVTLTDVVKDADLSWNGTKIDFSKAKVLYFPQAAEDSGNAVEPTPSALHRSGSAGTPNALVLTRHDGSGLAPASAVATQGHALSMDGDKLKFSYKGMEVEFEWKPKSSDRSLDMQLTLTPHDSFAGKLTTSVHVNPLTMNGGTKVSNGNVDQFKLSFDHLSGTAKVVGEMTSQSQVGNFSTPAFLKLPFEVPIPIPIGGIPFKLIVSGKIELHLAISQAGDSLRAEANVTFSGATGLSMVDKKVTLSKGGTSKTVTKLSDLSGVDSGPVGLEYVTELPRLQFGLGLLAVHLGVFVSNGMVSSYWLSGSTSPLHCRQLQLASVVAGGVDGKFLGLEVEFTRKTLLPEEVELLCAK